MTDQAPMPVDRYEYANILISRLLETMASLTSLYENETEALRSQKTKVFSRMQDEKLSHIRIYENTLAEMRHFANEIKAMPDDNKTKIRQSQAHFAALIANISSLLQTTQQAMGRVGETLGKAMRGAAHQSNAVNYDAGGKLSSKDRKTISSGRISASA
jgi:hypothetical protein